MRAIFIAVGSELLDLDRVDTNSIYVARRLREKGILMDMKVVVGDHMDNLSWIVKKACQRAQLVILSGGLGPTEDDITREAVATALKKELVFREEIVAELREDLPAPRHGHARDQRPPGLRHRGRRGDRQPGGHGARPLSATRAAARCCCCPARPTS